MRVVEAKLVPDLFSDWRYDIFFCDGGKAVKKLSKAVSHAVQYGVPYDLYPFIL